MLDTLLGIRNITRNIEKDTPSLMKKYFIVFIGK